MTVTGFTPEQRDAVLLRDGGMCAMRGTHDQCRGRADDANHRLNRGAGGTSDRGTGKNGMGNACAICFVCNGLIESDPELAAIARHRGVKLEQGDRPELVALWSPFFRQWVQVTDHALYLLGETDLTARPEILDTETGEIAL